MIPYHLLTRHVIFRLLNLVGAFVFITSGRVPSFFRDGCRICCYRNFLYLTSGHCGHVSVRLLFLYGVSVWCQYTCHGMKNIFQALSSHFVHTKKSRDNWMSLCVRYIILTCGRVFFYTLHTDAQNTLFFFYPPKKHPVWHGIYP